MSEFAHSDIVVELRIGIGSEVDPKLLIEALDVLEGALYASDRADVERAGLQLPVPRYVRDATLERLRTYRHRRIHIREARTGSLILIGAVAAVSYFVLEKTIGEAFADGFKDSNLYRELRTFFRNQIDRKALTIAEGIRRGFGARHRNVTVIVDSPRDVAGPSRRIFIDVAASEPGAERRIPPSLGEALDSEADSSSL